MVDSERHDQSRKLLGDAVRTLEMLLGSDDLPVSTEVCHGQVVATLAAESRRACLVVLQRGMRKHGHSPVLSVTLGVAARAHAPAVVIPAEWLEPEPGTDQVVTVGIGDDSEDAHWRRGCCPRGGAATRTLRIVHSEGDQTLLARRDDTALFVVGRQHLPLLSHSGPTARSLLRHSPVPVMVLAPGGEVSHDPRRLATTVAP